MSITINADNVLQVACQEAGCRCVPIASKELPVSIKLAIEKDMEENSYFGKYGSVVLPVESIDCLKVKCNFIVNHNGMSISIRCDNLQMYAKADETSGIDGRITRWKKEIGIRIEQILFRKTYIKKLTKYTLKDYESVLKHIHKDIKVMKFDKLNGVLTTPEYKHPKEAPHIWGHYDLTNLPCDEEDPEECSVCLDATKTTTACGHKLCVACWSSIKKKRETQAPSVLPCPICRDDLYQTEKIFGKGGSPVGHDTDDDDECDDWSDSDDDDDDSDDDDDDDIQYARFPEPIEFPSVRQNNIMDMY
jgi:hypothetical protein